MPSFLTPTFLWLSLLAVPIILMYMLRLRRQEVMVSSTLLWEKLLRDREANAPWQKLRRNLLLLLQLLLLLLFVLALARPFIPVSAVVTGNVVVLLDGSASMLATDLEPNRFAVAKKEVAQLIDELSGGDQMSLILVGETPQLLLGASQNRAELRAALEKATVSAGEVDWRAAFAFASGAAQGFSEAQIVIVSDGGLPAGLPPLPAEINYISVGEKGENLALFALATRETPAGPELFVSVGNTGLLLQEGLISLRLDGVLFDSKRISIQAGERAQLSWLLPKGTAVVEAALTEQSNDFFPLDDIAWAVHEGGVENRVLLVTEGNLFLEQLYAVLPGVDAFKTDSLAKVTEKELFDLYVFDSVLLPDPLPQADLLLINPQNSTALFQLGEMITNTAKTIPIRVAETPLLRYVDWGKVHLRQFRHIDALGGESLVDAEGGGLIIVGEVQGNRYAILPFDLHDSDLPLQIAYPILMANLTHWLSPGRAFELDGEVQLGDLLPLIPAAGSQKIRIEKPDGRLWQADIGEEALFFSETDQLGLYVVSLEDETGVQGAGQFTVNLFSEVESEINPRKALQLNFQTVNATNEGDVGQWEFGYWLLVIAFLITFIEWWVHHRGARLPTEQDFSFLTRKKE